MKKNHNHLPRTTADLAGKTWLRNGSHLQVNTVSEDGLTLHTHVGKITFKNKLEAEHWLAECLPVDEDYRPSSTTNKPAMLTDSQGNDVGSILLNGLLADFEKLEKDPGYIQQAKQRSNQVTAMMNVVKTQLQLEKHNQK